MKLIYTGRASRSLGLLLALTAIDLSATSALAQTASDATQAPKRTVDINEYFVQGNTLLSDADIERAVYPYLGPQKTLDDIERARAALQTVFETHGYKTVIVEIPKQNVVGGRVVLNVVEARLGHVEVAGAKHSSDRRIEAALPALAEGEVPDLDRFGTQLGVLNGQSADRQVTPELKAGTEPGTIDAVLTVQDKVPLHGSLEVSNRYSEGTTRTRLQAGMNYNDLWGAGHSISAFYAVAPERPDDSQVVVLDYGLPLSNSLHFDVSALSSNSNVATVGSTDVLGNGSSVTAALSKTLPSIGNYSQSLSLSVAWKDFKEDVTFGTDTSHAPITYYPVSVDYTASTSGDTSSLNYNLGLTFALRGLAGSDSLAFDNKRFLSTGGFAYLRAGATYRHDLPKGASFRATVNGQLANEPLISNEQFAAGGASSVRGYFESQAIGDDGVSGSLELRSPSFAGRLGAAHVNDLRLLVFADAAQVFVKNPLAEQKSFYDLASLGTGLRLKLFDHVNGDLDLAWPLRTLDDTRAGHPRLHFRFSADY